MLRGMLWGACYLVLTAVVAFGLLHQDRHELAIGAVGWALAAAVTDSGAVATAPDANSPGQRGSTTRADRSSRLPDRMDRCTRSCSSQG